VELILIFALDELVEITAPAKKAEKAEKKEPYFQ
jgi:hypothetical protein